MCARRNAKKREETLMLTSRDRILTTHAGSLPRNETITELLIKREAGEVIDAAMSGELDRAVAEW
jgi:5-methyltetrahydropteroyltriglutamate--homocysteine methyltransferase